MPWTALSLFIYSEYSIAKNLTTLYDLIMEAVSPREANTYGKLLAKSSPKADKIRQKWHEPAIGINKLKISSRSINYYEAIGLIKDPRGDKKAGWRKFTYIEAVYLLILCELRKYGIDTSFIKTFYDLFVKNDDKFFTDSVLLAHLGYKMTIVIEANQKEQILEVPELVERERRQEKDSCLSEIRINLSGIVYRLNDLLKTLPDNMALWFCSDFEDGALENFRKDWSEIDNILVEKRRQMKRGESFEMKYTMNGETVFNDTKPTKLDERTEKTLIDTIGDFGSATITVSGGKAANTTIKKSTKL